jgi:mutator protein MutT
LARPEPLPELQAMNERSYPDHPWVGVGGIIFQGDQVLLIKRGKEPGLGLWSIPGGIVEVGETAIAALRREMEEETGLEVAPIGLVEVFERIFPDKEGRILYHYVILDYLCSLKGGRLKAGSDVTEAAFVPLTQLSAMGVSPEARGVIEKAYTMTKVFS